MGHNPISPTTELVLWKVKEGVQPPTCSWSTTGRRSTTPRSHRLRTALHCQCLREATRKISVLNLFIPSYINFIQCFKLNPLTFTKHFTHQETPKLSDCNVNEDLQAVTTPQQTPQAESPVKGQGLLFLRDCEYH